MVNDDENLYKWNMEDNLYSGDDYTVHDEDLRALSMTNAFLLITGKLSADMIMDLSVQKIEYLKDKGAKITGPEIGSLVFFPFNPKEYDDGDIQDVIDYYAELELYEQCSELKKCKENGTRKREEK